MITRNRKRLRRDRHVQDLLTGSAVRERIEWLLALDATVATNAP